MLYFANLWISRYPLLLIFLLVISATNGALAQSYAKRASAAIGPGVVVEKVDKDWSADKAGLQKGDLLLSWSHSGTEHKIESPLDVWRAEAMQRTGAEITLNGTRGQAEQHWRLVPGSWFLTTRPNFHGELLSSYVKGVELANSGNISTAVEVWRKIRVSDSNTSAGLWLLLHIARTAVNAHLWEAADSAYTEALTNKERLGPLLVAQVLGESGNSYFNRENLRAAKEKFRLGLEECHTFGDATIISAHILAGLGLVAARSGEPENARSYFASALQKYEELIPSGNEIPSYLIDLGSATYTSGDLQKAKGYYREAWQISQKSTSHYGQWAALEGLCIVADQESDLESAESYCTRALKEAERKAPSNRALADNLNWLGDVYRNRGDLEEARRLQERGLEIRQKIAPGSVSLAGDLANLGLISEEEGDLDKAVDLILEALTIQRRNGPRSLDVANTLVNLCKLSRRRGKLNEADAYCHEALEISTRSAPAGVGHAEILRNLGDVERDLGKLVSAEGDYLQAVSILANTAPSNPDRTGALAALAQISRYKGNLEMAAEYYRSALEALRGQTAHLGGSNEIRAEFRARHEDVYREYIDLLIAQKKPEAAFSVLERSRGRILLETLAAAHVDVHRGADPGLLKRERGLRADINAKSERRIHLLSDKHTAEQADQAEQIKAVEKEISDLTAQYQEVEAQLRSTSPNYAALTQPQPLTAKEIQQQLLDRDTLLLEYSLGEKHSHLFAVTPDSLHVFELPGRVRVERQARRVYRLLTARNHSVRGESFAQRQKRWRRADIAYQREARVLSRMILGPVAAQMKDKRLLIVADGALYYIPFAALPEPDGTKKSSPPLAVNHEIVSLPSASVLALLRQQAKDRKPAPQAVAVLADPVFDKNDPRVSGGKPSAQPASVRRAKPQSGEGDSLPRSFSAGLLTRSATDLGLRRNGRLTFSRLRYTRQEADAIRAVTPPSKVLEAVDFRASRATATSPELANYRIVHFATHGLLNSKHPELSGLVLSLVDKQGKPRDGFLTLQDIYNMNLSADLVVLSACETGLGKEISGEGLIGMTRGFMYAGASRVMASLWNVSDVATARLMADFYKAMEEDGLSPAAALRAAQVKMWKQRRWRSPYYWAAFQIQGEWR